jgi:CheY-like chemotaxis protein
VLVVEDNGDAARSLADLLELSGHEVAVAGDGAEGLALARTARFDAVLCDLGLPGLDGYAVARALRGDAATRDLLLVAVSGYAQAEDRERARAAGFDAHLAKPPRLDDLERLLADGAPARAAEGR